MLPLEVPEVVVLRLPLYVRALTQIAETGTDVVSSQQLGSHLQMTPAQIRKDLSYFGRFGKQGRGYNVKRLLQELREIRQAGQISDTEFNALKGEVVRAAVEAKATDEIAADHQIGGEDMAGGQEHDPEPD